MIGPLLNEELIRISHQQQKVVAQETIKISETKGIRDVEINRIGDIFMLTHDVHGELLKVLPNGRR